MGLSDSHSLSRRCESRWRRTGQVFHRTLWAPCRPSSALEVLQRSTGPVFLKRNLPWRLYVSLLPSVARWSHGHRLHHPEGPVPVQSAAVTISHLFLDSKRKVRRKVPDLFRCTETLGELFYCNGDLANDLACTIVPESSSMRRTPTAGTTSPTRRPPKCVETTPVSHGRKAPPSEATAKSRPSHG